VPASSAASSSVPAASLEAVPAAAQAPAATPVEQNEETMNGTPCPQAQSAAAQAATTPDAGRPEEANQARLPRNPRQLRRPRRVAVTALPEDVDLRLAQARWRKQVKRRVRGEDYEQVTVILDRELYLELDRRLGDQGREGGGVKISRSMLLRALVREFLASHRTLSLDGLFTPDPRSQEELEILEAALLERLRDGRAAV